MADAANSGAPNFPVAVVFDSRDESGTAVMGPDHERIPPGDERDRLIEYLRSAPAALATMARDTDRVDESQGKVVPMSFRTDGVWLWSDELVYYLELYGFAPETALREHIRSNGYQVPEVPRPVLIAASRTLI
jgi:hypothetical protein